MKGNPLVIMDFDGAWKPFAAAFQVDWFRMESWKRANPRLVTFAVGAGGLISSLVLTALSVMLMELLTPAPVLIAWIGLGVAAIRAVR